MDITQEIMWGVIILAILILSILFIFRKTIEEAIHSGRSLRIDFGLQGSKLEIGALDKSAPSKNPTESPINEETGMSPESDQIASSHVDVKLIPFIPPLQPGRFRIVTLPSEDPPEYFNWPYSPTGLSVYYEIPFILWPVVDMGDRFFGHAVLTSQPSRENVATIKTINVNESRITHVHFLISAGHGYREHRDIVFLHKRIGHLEIGFSDRTNQRVDLILGSNIREWAFGNSTNLVTEIDRSLTIPAWQSHDNTKRFDLLSVAIIDGPKDILSIEVAGKFEEEHLGMNLLTPAIIISAITCESRT